MIKKDCEFKDLKFRVLFILKCLKESSNFFLIFSKKLFKL